MIISYQGLDSFKISQGNLGIAVNPRSKTSADITLFSNEKSPAYAEALAGKAGFVIDGPGEYEIKDVFIKGFLSEGPSTSSGQARLNTIYLISLEGMKLCFLGALANPEIKTETLEALEDIDILFTPAGGDNTIDAAKAYKLAVSLEPSVVIPMNYGKKELDQFIKEGGEKAEPIDKLVVKKKDLEGKESEIIILKEE